MPDRPVLDDSGLGARRVTTPSPPRLVLLVALVTELISIATATAAILVPAPATAAPLVVALCVGAPVFAGWEVPAALSSVRAERAHARALAALHRSLDELPEVEHPLGL